ncbi:S1 family peptidase [Paracoccus niistensis]|uniref:Serine protease n=1 Tax=Paracoccus niistensis TaxID=632935 RepID=A0ABV6I8L5_9RHOB
MKTPVYLFIYATLVGFLQASIATEARGDGSLGSSIFSHYASRAAHVETTVVMRDGSIAHGHGSGFLISDNLIITNKHVVPEYDDASVYIVKVRLSSIMHDPLIISDISRSETEDIAVLRIEDSTNVNVSCPVMFYESTDVVQPGDQIFVLGYPLSQDLSIFNGIISNMSDPKKWQTNSLFNKGSSGGPVFSQEGAFIGVAVGGIVCWPSGAEKCHDVDGVNFFIPAVRIFQASPHADLSVDHLYEHACWDDAGGDLPSTTPTDTLSRAFSFSQTKDDHPIVLSPHSRVYGESLDDILRPEPGYRLTACTLQPSSANNAHDGTCNILPGGERAQFRVRLESGPALDRWRGWWTGTIVLNQEKI